MRDDAPPIPTWQITRAMARVRAIIVSCFDPWLGSKIEGSNLNHIASYIADEVGGDDLDKVIMAATESLMSYDGQTLDSNLARKLALRIAWNRSALMEGTPFQRFKGAPERTWMPFGIVGFSEGVRYERRVAIISLLCIGSVAAGCESTLTVPYRFIYVLGRDLGFSWQRQLEDPNHLLGLWFAGLVEPSLSDDIEISRYKCTPVMKKHNTRLIHKRVPKKRKE